MASKKADNPAFAHIVAILQRTPDVDYATVRSKAEAKGLTVHPIMYGRAKAMLGLVPIAKRGEGKAKKASAPQPQASGVPVKRGRGRPRKVPQVAAPAPVERQPFDAVAAAHAIREAVEHGRTVLQEVDRQRALLVDALDAAEMADTPSEEGVVYNGYGEYGRQLENTAKE